MNEKKKCEACGGVDLTAGGKCRTCKAGAKGKTIKARSPSPATAKPSLEIQRCYGLKASIDDSDGDPYLIVEQSDGDDKDTICLSRLELRHLVEKFGSWAGIAPPQRGGA